MWPSMSVPAPDAAAVLRDVDWQVLRHLDGVLQGDHRTARIGAGTDLSDIRLYRPDDDIRHIDWNVTARSGEPHVRQFVEDRELTTWFLIDRSRSMSVGAVPTKEQTVARFVAAVAQLLVRRGDRVGAVLWNDGLERVIEPGGSRAHLLSLTQHLLDPAPPSGTTTRIDGLFSVAAERMRRRSLVFVLSDLLVEPGWEASLRRLGRRHEVIVIHCINPDESTLPDAGIVVIEDAETGEQLVIDTDDPGFRERFVESHTQRAAQLRAAVGHAGADLHELATGEDLVPAITTMVRRRAIRRRAIGGRALGRQPGTIR